MSSNINSRDQLDTVQLAKKVIRQVPDSVPVIVKSQTTREHRGYFLFKRDTTYYWAMKEIGKQIQGSFSVTGTATTPSASASMISIYTKHVSNDGFLYILVR